MSEFDIKEITVESILDAEKLFAGMNSKVQFYGVVLVEDLYDLAGITSEYKDHLYGWYSTRGMGHVQKEGYVRLTFPEPRCIPVRTENKNLEALDVVFKNYAERARVIYDSRTAGDFTWEGFLASFLNDAKKHL